jgi:RimJ/RimL family protein N-acetyltransferase
MRRILTGGDLNLRSYGTVSSGSTGVTRPHAPRRYSRGMTPVTLHTARLTLSPPTSDDVDTIFAACQDPDVQRYTTVPTPYLREHAVGFVEKAAGWWEDGTELTWGIRHDDELVGMIGLHRVARGNAEIGYWMAPGGRRRGFPTEAAREVIAFGFAADGAALSRIEWRAVVGNIGSARLARAVGIRYEGLLRQSLLNGAGERFDAWVGGLLASDDRMPRPWPPLGD